MKQKVIKFPTASTPFLNNRLIFLTPSVVQHSFPFYNFVALYIILQLFVSIVRNTLVIKLVYDHLRLPMLHIKHAVEHTFSSLGRNNSFLTKDRFILKNQKRDRLRPDGPLGSYARS